MRDAQTIVWNQKFIYFTHWITSWASCTSKPDGRSYGSQNIDNKVIITAAALRNPLVGLKCAFAVAFMRSGSAVSFVIFHLLPAHDQR